MQHSVGSAVDELSAEFKTLTVYTQTLNVSQLWKLSFNGHLNLCVYTSNMLVRVNPSHSLLTVLNYTFNIS